jgi:hypothetical protein
MGVIAPLVFHPIARRLRRDSAATRQYPMHTTPTAMDSAMA